MKEERFEKVVKWKKEPNYVYIFLSILMVILVFISSFSPFPDGGVYKEEVNGFLRFVYTLVQISGMGALIVGGVALFFHSIGRGRKVYWRKIK